MMTITLRHLPDTGLKCPRQVILRAIFTRQFSKVELIGVISRITSRVCVVVVLGRPDINISKILCTMDNLSEPAPFYLHLLPAVVKCPCFKMSYCLA